MKVLLPLFLLFFILTGCSVKNSEVTFHPQEKNLATNEQENDEELFDEFSDELEEHSLFDPLSRYNRVMTSFNDNIYNYLLIPAAKGYKQVVHLEIRKSVKNFFHNVYFPIRFVNNLLQGKFQNATEETGRFVINTTLGIGGIFDFAKSEFDLKAHEEDFGQTLGFYGVGAGMHIVLPLLGPSNLRDMVGIGVDSYASPFDYDSRDYFSITENVESFAAFKTFEYVNNFSLNIEQYEKLKEDAVDLYPYLRDVYEQRREQLIKE